MNVQEEELFTFCEHGRILNDSASLFKSFNRSQFVNKEET